MITQTDLRSALPAELASLHVPVSPGSLSDLVYESLRDAITSGLLEPGYRLREIPLGQRFGVSTTPIREALRRLEREGLVEIGRNRGAIVAAFDVGEVANLFELREVLECRGVRRAALAHRPALAPIEAILRQAEAQIDNPDQIAFNRLDVGFHSALIHLGGNAYLADLAERVHRQIQGIRVRLAVYLPGRATRSQADHRAILAAVAAHDADRAEELMRSHIQSVREAVLTTLGQCGAGRQ